MASPPADAMDPGGAELDRLRALHALGVLDTAPSEIVDGLAHLARLACGTPVGVVSLIDAHRQWFKAACGIDAGETSRDDAFCAFTIQSDAILEIPDALEDPRFRANPFVTGEPHIRFYAGAPLIGRNGHRFGALCVVDYQPRTLTPLQRELLQGLARQVVEQLYQLGERREAELHNAVMQATLESMPDGMVTCDAAGMLSEFNATARAWHGVDPRRLPAERWAEHFDLFEADGVTPLAVNHIPLQRAFLGETVNGQEIVIRAAGQAARTVHCNARPTVDAAGMRAGAVCVMYDVTEARATEQALMDERARLASVIDASRDVSIIATRTDGIITLFNSGAEQLLGYTADEIVGRQSPVAFHLQSEVEARGDELSALAGETVSGFDVFVRASRDGRAETREWTYVRKDGIHRRVRLSVSPLMGADGAITGFLGMAVDLTAEHRAKHQRERSEARLRAITDNAPAVIVYLDRGERFRFVNTAFCDWYGMQPHEVFDRTIEQVRGPEARERVAPLIARCLAGEHVVAEAVVPHVRLGDRACQITFIPDVAPDGEVRGCHVMAYDITAQKALTRVMEERAMTDELTGLPNRAAWTLELDREVVRAARDDVSLAVLFIDLDGFKTINDEHGHAAGDEVLREFARRLRSVVRTGDFAARLAGDEFVVLLRSPRDAGRCAQHLAQRIERALGDGMTLGSVSLTLAASIGIASQPAAALDAAGLMRDADEAMYRAKHGRAVSEAVP